MIKAIKEDYTISKDKVNGGSFNDYEQRDYDFNILSWRNTILSSQNGLVNVPTALKPFLNLASYLLFIV